MVARLTLFKAEPGSLSGIQGMVDDWSVILKA
jgi:hypothetical protein